MMNRAMLIGRLTRDPEKRHTPQDIPVTTFTIAVDRPYSRNQGEKETDFIPVVCWRQLADFTHQYIGKGRLVAVEGRIQVRSYDNKEGNRVYVTEIVADNVKPLESAKRDNASPSSESYRSTVEEYTYGEPPVSNQSRGTTASQNQSKKTRSNDEQPVNTEDFDLPF